MAKVHGEARKAKINCEICAFIRRRLDISQRQVAKMFGLSRGYIHALSAGRYWKHCGKEGAPETSWSGSPASIGGRAIMPKG
jgi:hypothetical protein